MDELRIIGLFLVLAGGLGVTRHVQTERPSQGTEGSPQVPSKRAQSSPAASAFARGEPMDLNAASALDLTLLPGIGPALAGRIVAHRESHGPFRSVAALQDVPGIGPRTLARIRTSVRVPEVAELGPNPDSVPDSGVKQER